MFGSVEALHSVIPVGQRIQGSLVKRDRNSESWSTSRFHEFHRTSDVCFPLSSGLSGVCFI